MTFIKCQECTLARICLCVWSCLLPLGCLQVGTFMDRHVAISLCASFVYFRIPTPFRMFSYHKRQSFFCFLPFLVSLFHYFTINRPADTGKNELITRMSCVWNVRDVWTLKLLPNLIRIFSSVNHTLHAVELKLSPLLKASYHEGEWSSGGKIPPILSPWTRRRM
jgi:hypothetical protein